MQDFTPMRATMLSPTKNGIEQRLELGSALSRVLRVIIILGISLCSPIDAEERTASI
jgi:hypothetical protein